MHGSSPAALIAGFRHNGAGRLHGFERRLHFAGALIAERGLLGETTLNDGRETGWYSRGQRRRRLTQNGGGDFKAGSPLKWHMARGGLIQHDAKRPQVAAMISGLAA